VSFIGELFSLWVAELVQCIHWPQRYYPLISSEAGRFLKALKRLASVTSKGWALG
jgi:hypothetical protein